MKTTSEAGKLIVDIMNDGQRHNGDIVGPDKKIISKVNFN
ncbi:hypothetical protein NBRC111893_346 [Lentilactobacillus kosonis]|uniref:Uncharacterized protein n=2 Tax=Lentilactobacillus kosonis TaxID=2810561 RepID=A0A401FII9_9LACO|nr:hypothetical protein NBRC111893_346 [Lentilactobacillus kosonis]